VSIGVLTEQSISKEKLFMHPKLMRLLSADENHFEPYSEVSKEVSRVSRGQSRFSRGQSR
jgi:hypothetical protein